MERKIGQGNEHIVTQSACLKHVRKLPTATNILSFILTGSDASVISTEVEHAYAQISNTNIRIPNTKVRVFNKFFYVIIQEYIENHGNNNKIKEELQNAKKPNLLREHFLEPRNFALQNGQVYWIDPTKGPFTRVLHHWGIMNPEQYATTKAWLKRITSRKNLNIITSISLTTRGWNYIDNSGLYKSNFQN